MPNKYRRARFAAMDFINELLIGRWKVEIIYPIVIA